MEHEKVLNHTQNIIQYNVPLRNKNWFQTGGNARYYAEPQTIYELILAYQYAKDYALDLFILGQGANCLISDDGFDGLIIKPTITDISHTTSQHNEVLVTAGAGTTIENLIAHCLDHNIVGLEEFSGIPGSIGGAVYINLHYFDFLLEQFLVSATILDTVKQTIEVVDTHWFDFGYDYSKLHTKQHILLNATFTLKQVSSLDASYARGRSHEIIRHRHARYPHSHTCGSFFRNFHDHEVTSKSNGEKMIYAAYYLDAVGAKGNLKYGGATVSHKHANMIVTNEAATSRDVIQLARTMQEKVFDQCGIMLQPECELIGFKEYPLHKNASHN